MTTMATNRSRIFLTGAALALTAGVLADQGARLGADLPHTSLLGLALGAVVGLVPDRSITGRLAGFLTGFFAAWLGYALRAGFLPDIPLGRAVAAVTVVGVITAVAVASSGRLPLWSALVGAASLLGAYETTFAAAPTGFVADSLTAATTALLAAAVGLLVASALSLMPARSPKPRIQDDPEGESVSLDTLLLPAPRPAVDADLEQEVTR